MRTFERAKIVRMKKAHRPATAEKLVDAVVLGMQEVKARDIVHLDLRGIPNAVCDHFVICQGGSNTQVDAIVRSVEKFTLQKAGEKPWHVEGREHAGWVLMDYVNVVVHVFLPETRGFYGLDQLWADAARRTYENVA
jgi:ribosome-associated protein